MISNRDAGGGAARLAVWRARDHSWRNLGETRTGRIAESASAVLRCGRPVGRIIWLAGDGEVMRSE